MTNFSGSHLTPCTDKWNNFVPTEKGGFCKLCFKEVVELDKMTNEEIKAYFTRAERNFCGRFKGEQHTYVNRPATYRML